LRYHKFYVVDSTDTTPVACHLAKTNHHNHEQLVTLVKLVSQLQTLL